ncbi:MAG TPA: SRPBCC domain-containing protein [Stellaceae bacterium]|nr:SRPBCC domain-containing protein [Stellaceae bacterium]
MSDDRTLIIRRVLDAPREMVFAAWTDPKQAARWWGPKGFTTVSNQMDVRVGGEWRRVMRSPEGTEHSSRGVYREIAAPERLVFTYRWERGGAAGHGPETIVTVTFADLGKGRTELTLRQEEFATIEGRDDHNIGWSGALDCLADYLQTQSN